MIASQNERLKHVFLFGFAILFLFVPFLAFSQNSPVSGGSKEEVDDLNSQIQSKKKAIEELEKSIADLKVKKGQVELKKVSLQNQVAILDNRVTQVELDIKLTEQKRDAINLEIQALDITIGDKEEILTRQRKMVGEFIRTIHYNDNKNYIEIAASYDNFSDFYNQVQYVKTVEEDLGRSVKNLRLTKEDLEIEKGQREKNRDAYNKLNEELQQKKKDLQEQRYVKEDLLFETQSSEATYATLLSRLRQEYQKTEKEISSIELQVRHKLEAGDKLETLPDDGSATSLSWPTQSRYVTTRFHDPDYPFRNVFEHNAIDIRSAQGTPVKATASGCVARAKYCTVASCYAYVMIIHSGGISTVYGHLNQILVTDEQCVGRGDIIGYSGAQPGTIGAGPFTTGPHLHFEVRKDGIPVDPLAYLVRDY